jgi:ferrous iron transport protein B
MKQTLIAAGYLFALAYCASLITYQVAKALGAG